tara:strand:+ start:928 stop:1140 length:213 start_codon:yes stop_codon:yes gene_type:complete
LAFNKSYKEREVDMTQQQEVMITMEDLERLFTINPMAREQFNGILKDKRIKELEEQIAESNEEIVTIEED